ncbi:MAG: site-2 protease family protein [Gammaproteobacteria bacterium]
MQALAVAAIPILFAITLHEVAHGWMARHFGDPTAAALGRLSLNPIKHIDPVGTVVVPVLLALIGGFLFGWAKPVPINFARLNKPKRDMIAVALAGPGANLVMAVFWALVLKMLLIFGPDASTARDFFLRMAEIGIFFNVLLGIFNLVPIPPLDGGRVLRGLVSESIGTKLDRIEPFGLIIIVGLLFFGFLWPIMAPAIALGQKVVLAVVGL